MKKIAVFFCVVFSLAVAAVSQTRTVTNLDLQKFERQRLADEREYRETYARRGMLSPEEIDRLNDQRSKEIIELASKLQSSELEREKLRAEVELRRYTRPVVVVAGGGYKYPSGTVYGGWDGFVFGDASGRRVRGRGYTPPYYAAGGSTWPAPVGSVHRGAPLFRIRPRPPIIIVPPRR
ncbi:MAG: hypothetical protein ACK4S4_08940 [Pyrinomonadaceae bacterium]